jgi:ribonuclease BN (tRNA processing enzyme)
MTNTKVVLLGTGTPALTPGRYQSATAIIVNDQPYIVDCGSGCLERIVEARSNGTLELAFEKLNKLFLTHFHPDHTVGLPGFLISPWIRGRRVVDVFGPTGTKEMIEGILTTFKKGINEHLYHGPKKLDNLRVDANDFTEGVIYKDELVEVEAIKVMHGTFDAYGFKFNTPDKTIVLSGDTRPVPKLYQKAANCDILIHEVYCEAEIQQFPQGFRKYFKEVHTSGTELGRIAQEVNPGLLVLTHQILYNRPKEELIDEIRANYKGELAFGNDLDLFE